MRIAKVHMYPPHPIPWAINGIIYGTRCGRAVDPPYQMLKPEQFAWLPREAQCERCLTAMPYGVMARHDSPRSATPEMRIIVESIILSIIRALVARYDGVEIIRHEHRCFFRDTDPCSCGRVSATNWLVWCVAHRRWDPRFDHTNAVTAKTGAIERSADGSPAFGNWCRRCLRVRGEFHKTDCAVAHEEHGEVRNWGERMADALRPLMPLATRSMP